jgi:type II secretory pathway pseudopilin PulG
VTAAQVRGPFPAVTAVPPPDVVAVGVADVEAVLAGNVKAWARDTAAVTAFLHGVQRALLDAQERARAYQRQLLAQQSRVTRVGTPTTLNPLDAARFLDDEQKEALFDRIARQRLARLREQVAQAEAERDQVAAAIAQLRAVGRALAENADLPAHVRAGAARALATLPVEAPKVTHPRVLDFPDPPQGPTTAPPVLGPTATTATAGAPPAAGAPTFTTPSPAPVPAQGPTPAPGPCQVGAPVFVDPYGPTPLAGAGGAPTAAPAAEPVFVDPYAPKQTED